MAFNTEAFLESYKIPFKRSGINVSSGWLGIRCPFRGCTDHSNHMGVKASNPFQGSFHCWICGKKGPTPTRLIQALLKVSKEKAEEIVRHFNDDIAIENTESGSVKVLEEPPGLSSSLPKEYQEYLIGRGFDPAHLQSKYGLVAGGYCGFFAYRVVIPVIKDGQIVNYQGRDITGQQVKYKAYPNEKSVIPLRNCLFNIDSVARSDSVVIVEGVFDAMKIGDGAVATFGTEFTKSQIMQLIEKPIKNVFVLYDSLAERQAEKLAHFLTPFFRSVEILYIQGKKDPGEFNDEEVKQLRMVTLDKKK